MVRRLAAALPLALLSACSLLVDTGGLHDGSEPSPGDGASPVLTTVEAGADSDARATTTVDAAVGTSPCTMPHTFCDDFDTGDENLATRWSDLLTTAGPLDLDKGMSRSAPRSLRMNLTPTTGNKRSNLAKILPVVNGTARTEVDIFVPAPVGAYKELDPIALLLTPTPDGYGFHGLFLIIRAEGTSLQYFASKDNANLDNRAPVTMSKDAWHHVVMTVSYASTPPKGTVAIDGDVASVEIAGPAATKLELDLGAQYTEDTNLDWSLHFDNATIDTP